MPEIVKRGYVPSDEKEFGGSNLRLLQAAQKDVAYLLNRGYGIDKAVTFVGNRFMFSKRQRTALTRATASEKELTLRKGKMLPIHKLEEVGLLQGNTAYMDGFNILISLETALSGSTVLLCMDEVVRDLCGLHGTYRIIDKTDKAIDLVTKKLMACGFSNAVYYLDAPVSNSGRLKQLVLERSRELGFPVEVHLVNDPDSLLSDKENVVSSDAIVISRCKSWINLVRDIIYNYMPELKWIDLSQNYDVELY